MRGVAVQRSGVDPELCDLAIKGEASSRHPFKASAEPP